MKFLRFLAAVIFFPLACSGCASMLNGRTQPVMVVTDPAGAELLYRGESLESPTLINMPRLGETVVEIHKPGFATETVEFQRHSEGGLLVLTFLFYGGPIGLLVDLVNGAHYYLTPDTQHVALRALGPDEAAAADAAWTKRKTEIEEERVRRALPTGGEWPTYQP